MYIMVPSLMIFDKATCSNKNEEVKLSEELSSLQISRNFIVEESLLGDEFWDCATNYRSWRYIELSANYRYAWWFNQIRYQISRQNEL